MATQQTRGVGATGARVASPATSTASTAATAGAGARGARIGPTSTTSASPASPSTGNARTTLAARTAGATGAAATGSSASAAVGPATAARRQVGQRTAAARQPIEVEDVPTGVDPSAVADISSGRASRRVHVRRPSQMLVEKEKKTEYWQGVAEVASKDGAKLSGDEMNNVISRALSLGIVGDKKQRESLSGPSATELLNQLKDGMESRLKELGGGQINTDVLLKTNATLMEKIMGLEKVLTALEKRKTDQEEQERAKVQNKIGELERSLRELEKAKVEQRENNRRTMKLEIANLKEMMSKVQQEKQNESAATAEAKQMAAKMARLEAALRLMNEERKKKVEDKETVLLKRKLALFEQKLKEMEESKRVQQTEQESNDLRDKLVLMEDKLQKMEKRKSMSMTMEMQQKMDAVEKQLTMLRNEKAKGQSDDMTNKINAKMAQLEQQLKFYASQQITPAMVNDEETVALRNHVKKLEEAMMLTEKKMDDQRQKLEEERRLAYERRVKEEEEFRRQAREKEEALIQKLIAIEKRLGQSGGGGGAAASNPDIAIRLKELEKKGGNADEVAAKLKALEDKLEATQKALIEERGQTKSLIEAGGKNGISLQDFQIEYLKHAQAQLLAKIEAQNKMMDEKMEQMKKFVLSAPAGGAPVHKSGLSYDEINKKLADIQAKLFDPNTDERESEQLNIEYEKLITELEGTAEYQAEQEKIRAQWKKDNEPLNRAAFEQVTANLKAMNDTQSTNLFKKKPELRLLLRTPDQILKAHENDFKQLSTQMLDLDEARALYHNMPVFRKDQQKQVEWVQQLQQKIEVEASKPKVKAPPPIQAQKKVVIVPKAPAADDDGSGGGFLEELLKKRKKRD